MPQSPKSVFHAGPHIKTQSLSYIKDSKTNTHITLNYIKLQIKIENCEKSSKLKFENYEDKFQYSDLKLVFVSALVTDSGKMFQSLIK